MKKDKSKTKKIFFIILIVVAILVYMIPTLFIMGRVAFDIFDKTEYKEEGSNIIVEDGKVNITNLDAYYDSDREEYIISGYIDKVSKDYTIDLTFDLYDANDFIIGQAYTNLDMKKNESYKFKAIYYETDANEVVKYKINNINLYNW